MPNTCGTTNSLLNSPTVDEWHMEKPMTSNEKFRYNLKISMDNLKQDLKNNKGFLREPIMCNVDTQQLVNVIEMALIGLDLEIEKDKLKETIS